MLDFFPNLFHAMGREYTPPKEGAVGYGSVTVTGSRQFVDQLMQYASSDNSTQTPLGRLTLQAAHPVPGSIARILITGSVDGDPVTYAPKTPPELIDLAAGREAHFGAITLEGVLDLPEITYQAGSSGGEAIMMFPRPFIVRKYTDPNARRIRRRLEGMLSANLLGLKVNAHHGTPILSGVANWLAPQLLWT